MSARRSAATAIVLALALLAAPMRSAWRTGCDLCPPDCPMHRVAGDEHAGHDEAPPAAAKKMKCHNAVAAAAPRDDDEQRRLPRLSRPPCGSPAAAHGVALAPMILPEAIDWRVLPGAARAAPAPARAPRRGADPPDTPPPILPA